MRNIWLICNPHSGSATAERIREIEAICAREGVDLVGRTAFPDDALPSIATLAGAGVDTVALFGGDGTINAALSALVDWQGRFLILPGGTMNLLAKSLHDRDELDRIIAAARQRGITVPLPVVTAGHRCAYVGLILGPAASWVHAREASRAGLLTKMLRAARLAWRRTWGRGMRIGGVEPLRSRYQAVLVRPEQRGLNVVGIDARDLRSIAELGWNWLSGDWVNAHAVTQCHAQTLRIDERRPVLALFDGEADTLPPGTVITGTMSAPVFISTRHDAR